jgi:hypothetical protein
MKSYVQVTPTAIELVHGKLCADRKEEYVLQPETEEEAIKIRKFIQDMHCQRPEEPLTNFNIDDTQQTVKTIIPSGALHG